MVELTIEKVIFGGDGLARLAEGVRVREKKAHHARGEVVELLAPGPAREQAPCIYYQKCGGCQYQHLSYEEECRIKESQVREVLARVGKLVDAPVRPIIASPSPYGYRNRLTVHAAEGRIGFHRADGRGRELVDIEKCLLGREAVNSELARLRAAHPADGHYSLRDPAVPPSGFFQANHDLRDRLRQIVAEALPQQGDLLLEGYCGGGFFTEVVAERFKLVIAVDSDARTLLDARRLGLTNVEWHEADAAAIFPSALRDAGARETTVLLDPPREGIPLRLAEALGAYPAARLVYVSCDPATLARDARLLAGSYRLESVQPIDLFPRTAQIECVSVWERKPALIPSS